MREKDDKVRLRLSCLFFSQQEGFYLVLLNLKGDTTVENTHMQQRLSLDKVKGSQESPEGPENLGSK